MYLDIFIEMYIRMQSMLIRIDKETYILCHLLFLFIMIRRSLRQENNITQFCFAIHNFKKYGRKIEETCESSTGLFFCIYFLYY